MREVTSLIYSELFSNVNGAINRDCLILQWTQDKEKVLLVLLLPHLASVTAEMLEPRKCGRGSVQTKRRSTGLKARTVPSAQPQKIISSERDKQKAAPVYKTGRSRRVGSFQVPPLQIRQPSCLSAWNDKGHRRLQCSINASLLEYFQTHPVLVLANPSLILWQKAATHTPSSSQLGTDRKH